MADLAARESNPMDSFTTNRSEITFVGTTNRSESSFVGTTIPAPLVVENDAVNHPSHYTFGKIESIDYIDAVGLGYAFCIGNTLKYCSRAGHKDDRLQDLKKARWYLDHAIQKIESGEY